MTTMSNKDVVLRIQASVREALPEAKITVAAPAFEEGLWHADFVLEDRAVSVQLEGSDRIGVTVLPSDYGMDADEYFTDPDKASTRIREALCDRTEPALGKLIRELRAHCSLSQQELAEILSVQQPAVSKLERRDDVTVRMLSAVAERVGARFTISFDLGGRVIKLDPTSLVGSPSHQNSSSKP